MRARPNGLFPVIIAGLCLALVAVVRGAIHQPLIEQGDVASDFAFQTDDGRAISRASFGGKLLILNFWATWCGTCMAEMPSLNQLAADTKNDGVVIAAVSIDRNEQAYRRFVKDLRPEFLTSRDPEGDIAASFGTFRVPETYVIDATGRVVRKYISNRNWVDQAIVSDLRTLLR